MTDEVLNAIRAKTNAIDAVNDALQAEWTIIEELSRVVNADPVDMEVVRQHVKALQALNSALPAAVVANVVPSTAGPVGESPAEQTLKAGAKAVEAGLAQARDGVTRVQELVQALNEVVNGLNLASAGVATGEAAKQL